MESNIRWRYAESDDDAKMLAEFFMIDIWKEVGRAPMNPDKMFKAIYQCVQDKGAAMIFDGDDLIGSIGMIEVLFWYSDEPQFCELWAYVKPEMRGYPATARAVFSAARKITFARGFNHATMVVFNKSRSRARDGFAKIGEQFAFRPAGALINIEAAAA